MSLTLSSVTGKGFMALFVAFFGLSDDVGRIIFGSGGISRSREKFGLSHLLSVVESVLGSLPCGNSCGNYNLSHNLFNNLI